jgi:hypothetical protein
MASSVRVRHVLHLAAELNTKERAEVAGELIAGLDGVDKELTPAEWCRAWRDEIARRIADRPRHSLGEGASAGPTNARQRAGPPRTVKVELAPEALEELSARPHTLRPPRRAGPPSPA